MVLPSMESPPFDLQAYEPPISLWKLVEQYVPYHEREEIRNMLGESLVGQSQELHEEIDTLLEIWRDYREETTHCKPVPTLPEPPGVRDRLVQEIQFFVSSVKEKAKHERVNPDKFLSRHKQDVMEYALETYRSDSVMSPSRPGTARGGDGRETPMITSPTGSDRISAASSLSEEVESMNEKLTVLKFDEVVSHLSHLDAYKGKKLRLKLSRNTLEEEIETLMKDIYFLQNCLDDEATFRAETRGTLSREPTLSDLREERTKLEKDLFSDMKSQTSPTLKSSFNNPASLKPLGPVSTAGKMKINALQNSTMTAQGAMKSGPMKAFSSPESVTEGTTKSSHTGSVKKKTSGGDNAHINSSSHRPNMNKTQSSRDRYTGVPCDATGKLSQENVSHKYPGKDTENKVRVHSHRKSSLEAVVTLSKGNDGSLSGIQMTPSPPSSAKPTTSRPSSAQRFRSMVMNCRD